MREVRDRLRALDSIEAPDLRERISSWEPRALQTEPLLKRAAIALLALVVAAAGIAFAVRALRATEPPTPPATSIENGLIVFSRGGPDSGLFVMNGDGTGVRRLPSERGDGDATWSPDGSRIALVRYRDGSAGIFVMDADGSNARQLTDGGSDGSPAWSPDGTRIAFAREAREPGAEVANADIYVVNTDGTGLVRVTDDPVQESSPAWSPDGSRIAFTGYDEASSGRGPSAVRLYVMSRDGTDIRALGPEAVAQPAWSPDGSEIAYVDTETGTIMTIGPDGTGRRRVIDAGELVGGVHLVYGPVWSPDGTKITFMAGADAGNTHIYLVGRDGSGFTQLTNEPESDAEPAWQAIMGGDLPSPEATAEPSVADPSPPAAPPGATVGETIAVGQSSSLIAAAGSVWVAGFEVEPVYRQYVLRIDEESGEVLANIPVDAIPGNEVGGEGMAFDGRFVWVVGTSFARGEPDRGILVRIDPETNTAETFDLHVGAAGSSLVFDGQALWTMGVVSPGVGPRILRIDPASGVVLDEIPFEAEWWGSLVVVDGAMWITEMTVEHSTVQGDPTLVRIDPSTGEELARAPLGVVYGLSATVRPAAGNGVMWGVGAGEALRLDPATGEVLERMPAEVGFDLELGPDGAIWYLGRWESLNRLDPTTGETDVTVRLREGVDPIAIAVTGHAVWVLNYEGTLTRVGLS